jgi:hypothetical protein
MSHFTAVDFIAPMVELLIIYDAKLDLVSEPQWVKCVVHKVRKIGVTEDGDKFVVCNLHIDGIEQPMCETLYDSDFETVSQFAWMFSPSFAPLVNKLMFEMEEDTDEEISYESETDSSSREEVPTRPPKTTNIYATMLALCPWLASLAVVYNARGDVLKYLQQKY